MSSSAPILTDEPARKRLPLAHRLMVDVTAGCITGLAISPFVTTVDKAIFQNASGQKRMSESLKQTIGDAFKRPGKFFAHPSYRWITALYSCTYISANVIEHICERYHFNKDIPKFIGVSVVNVSICIGKDRAFARMFGMVSPGKVPKASLLLWLTRDCMTIGTSFNLPPYLAQKLHENDYFSSYKHALVVTQIICPVSVQLISTPLHLLGADLYNNKQSTIKERAAFIRKEYGKTTLARMARIFPSYGIGGVFNRAVYDYICVNVLLVVGDQMDKNKH